MKQALSTGPVAVVGALNLDVAGTPEGPLRLRDSTPGRITLRPGGVGRNIARHLAAAGARVELFTVLGDDDASRLLESRCAREGVGLRHALRLPGASPGYLCVHDNQGDMIAAVNDMGLLARLTPKGVGPWLPALEAAPLAVLDANLPQDVLETLAFSLPIPLLLDPVSGFKAERARRCLGRFAAVKPNRLEAALLSGAEDPAEAARWFLGQGVKRVFISLGEEGAYVADAEGGALLPAAGMKAPGCTGAGDAMAAGIALGMLLGLTTRDCARKGLELAAKHLAAQGGTPL